MRCAQRPLRFNHHAYKKHGKKPNTQTVLMSRYEYRCVMVLHEQLQKPTV